MTRWVRILLVAVVALGVLFVLALAVVHTEAVQEWAWERARAAIAEGTGWDVTADSVRLRLWPARLRASGMRLGTGESTVVRVDEAVMRWRWTALWSGRRLEKVEVRGVEADLDRLVSSADPAQRQEPRRGDPLRVMEVGRFTFEGAELAASLDGVEATLHELRFGGGLEDGRLRLDARAERLVLARVGRRAVLDHLSAAVDGDASGLDVEARVGGGAIGLHVDGTAALRPAVSAQVTVGVEGVPEQLLAWWDPELASRVRVSGRLALEGTAGVGPGGVTARLRHVGEPLRTLGYDIDRLALDVDGDRMDVTVGGSDWGVVEAGLVGFDELRAAVTLSGADPAHAVASLMGAVPQTWPKDLRLSGTAELRTSVPVDPRSLHLEVDVAGWAAAGRLTARGALDGTDWRVAGLELQLPGLQASGSGRGRIDGAVDADVRIESRDLPAVARFASRFVPVRPAPWLGGELTASLDVSGTVREPRLEGGVTWLRPSVAGFTAESVRVGAQGGLESLTWDADLETGGGGRAVAEGSASVLSPSVAGSWRVEIGRLGEALVGVGVARARELGGRLDAEGRFFWSPDRWNLEAGVDGVGVGLDGLSTDRIVLEASAGSDAATTGRLRAEAFGAVLAGHLREHNGALAGSLDLEELDLAALPVEVPTQARGTVNGSASFAGSLEDPQVVADVAWDPATAGGPVRTARFHIALSDGVAHLVSQELRTAGGSLYVDVVVPLGALCPLDSAPVPLEEGPVRLKLRGTSLELDRVSEALGRRLPVGMTTDVRLDGRWSVDDPDGRFADLELGELVIETGVETLRAKAPIRVALRWPRIELSAVTLSGRRTRVEAGGTFDLKSKVVDGTIDLVLAPSVAELLPFPIRLQGPILIKAGMAGPVGGASGSISFRHPDGEIVLQDPPVRVTDLSVEAMLENGSVWIEDGHASVNGGRAWIGGGWDRDSGQGIVFELKDVTFLLPLDIVSRWNGLLAIEPDPDRTARVVGDLQLDSGVWDRHFDLASAVLGPTAAAVSVDDRLQDVLLDVEVSGRGGIHVDNNLGQFDVSWRRLHVGGTAAEPRLRGELSLTPGGTLTVGGRTMIVRRGSVSFTGNPETDPVLEIVPAEGFGRGPGASVLAAQGVGSLLGLSNSSLRPEEIAVETETDPATRFTAGARLSPSVALMFTTDLEDVQDRATLLQIADLRGLGGLTFQAYRRTLDESQGVNVIQRFRWGGGEGTDDRPEIGKVRLEGDWPIGKRGLKSATKLRRGDPYTPFLLFTTEVRLQRELAERGWQEARVEGRVSGRDDRPTLTFECDPGPRNVVEFVGERPPKRVRREVTSLYLPPPMERPALANMRAALLRHYRGEGYPDVEATVTVEEVDIVAEVHPGRALRLTGPVVEPPHPEIQAVLERALGTPAELAALVADRERAERVVRRLLETHGYRDARLRSVDVVAVNDDEARVRVELAPGPRATIVGREVVGSDPLEVVETHDEIHPGRPFDRAAVEDAVAAIRTAYRERGYREAEIHARHEQLGDTKWRVEIVLEPGVRRRVTEVSFQGAPGVSRSVLRRGLEIEEGEVLLPDGLDASLVNLGTFAPVERVDVRTRPDGSEGVAVEFLLEEKPRWTVETGAGWNSERGAELKLGLRTGNLFGRGVGLDVRGRWSPDEHLALLYGTWPPAPGGKVSWGTTLRFEERDAPTNPDLQRERSTSASLEMTYGVRGALMVRPYLRFTTTEKFAKDPDFPFPSLLEDEIDVATFGANLIRDRLDNPFDPRSGTYLAVDLGISSDKLGSDLSTLRTLVTGSLALEPKSDWTLLQTVSMGYAEGIEGRELDPDQRFFVGGQASLRGFDRDSVGPTQPGLGGPAPAGGGALFLLNEELRVPVWGDVRLAVFADVGQVWESWSEAEPSLAVGAGLGVRVPTPIGPVWADVAWPVADRGISSGGPKFYVGIGRSF